MKEPGPRRPPLFLERHGYRRRRLADALRLLPVLGALLWLLPLLWDLEGAGTHGASTLLYLFGTWAALVVACAALVSRLEAMDRDGGDGW